MVKKDFIEEVTPGRSQETSNTYLPRAACGEQHSRQREQHVQRYRRQKENSWSCPDPGTWVAEWEMTQKPVGTDNAEHRGKKETLEGTSD